MRKEWLEKIKNNGYRLTAPRKAIVELVANSDRVLSPQEIYTACKRNYPGLGLVTVYRTLERLENLGLVQHVHQPDGCHRILPSGKGHQHILLCTGCGHAVYFGGDDFSGLVDELATNSGYQIRSHMLQLFGLCADCRLNAGSLAI
jgi:Fe2+ or Zn2+ uptake regulation protein